MKTNNQSIKVIPGNLQSPKEPVLSTIHVSSPNAVYYVAAKPNMSFNYSQTSHHEKLLSESEILDRKIDSLQKQIG